MHVGIINVKNYKGLNRIFEKFLKIGLNFQQNYFRIASSLCLNATVGQNFSTL